MSENEMLEEIKSLSPSEEAILTMLVRYQNLKAELEKEKEKNKELEDTLKTTQNCWFEDTKTIEDNKKYIVQLTDEQYRKLVDIIRTEISKEWEDKIKAKIEEEDKLFFKTKDVRHANRYKAYKELLEKE